MHRRSRVAPAILVAAMATLALGGCAGSGEQAFFGTNADAPSIPIDGNGFPLDWPVAVPPGSVNDCPNGEVSQLSRTFSIVFCVSDADPITVSQDYLNQLEAEGFAEREPGAFEREQQTFLDGNGLEIYFQLIGDEGTIVLVKVA